jgi:hypothetical protein
LDKHGDGVWKEERAAQKYRRQGIDVKGTTLAYTIQLMFF